MHFESKNIGIKLMVQLKSMDWYCGSFDDWKPVWGLESTQSLSWVLSS